MVNKRHRIKLLLKTIKSIDKLNATTSKYSKILIGLTIIMTIAVLVQVGLFFIDQFLK